MNPVLVGGSNAAQAILILRLADHHISARALRRPARSTIVAGLGMSLLLITAAWSTGAASAPLSIANEPLATAANQSKPNIAMIIDDSGSMVYSFVPDSHAPQTQARRCDGNSAYNPLFYNPDTVYTPPYKIDGEPHPSDQVTRFPDMVLENVLYDGYFPSGGNTFALTGTNSFFNLGSLGSLSAEQIQRLPNKPVCSVAGASCSETEKIPYYFSRNTVNPASNICEADDHYELVTDSNKLGVPNPLTKAYGPMEIARGKTNYANWFSYYRIRGSVMKQAVGEAFRDLDPDLFRVGLFFINSRTSGATVDNANNTDLPIVDFSDADRQRWYERLYGSRQSGWTPLRGALARVGRMMAGQVPDSSDDGMPADPNRVVTTPAPDASVTPANNGTATGVSGGGTGGTSGTSVGTPVQLSTSGRPVLHWDPIQSSCQKNQAILATDGAWNHFAENNRYGPFGIDEKRIGDLDSAASVPKPYKDSFGDAETLADVAYYFRNTDLRIAKCENTIGDRTYTGLCAKQGNPGAETGVRMTTSTIGLGISGDIPYTLANAQDPVFLSAIQWPKVVSDPYYPEDDKGKIDDIWHAAVNGGGTYFNASDPRTLQRSIIDAIQRPASSTGSGAGLAVSSSVPSAASNAVFAVSYRSNQWSGDVTAYAFDAGTGYATIDPTPVWSAQSRLVAARDGNPSWTASRKIRYFSAGTPDRLADFTPAGIGPDMAKLFTGFCDGQPRPVQCGTGYGKLSVEQARLANDSGNLINWLRGDSSNEIRPRKAGDPPDNPTGLYRSRTHVLGDIVNATPVYAAGPPFNYPFDPSYGEFKNARALRKPMLYAGANDGMLHAFDASVGDELWAFVPQGVMRNLWRLADDDYEFKHQYYVDGKVVLGDVCSRLGGDRRLCHSKDDWRSILVAGLNKGGCSYYALDVTDPDNPRGLWEFSSNNLGYSFGEPIIGKLKDGTWVVVLSSGYNQRYSNQANNCGLTATNAVGNRSIADVLKSVANGGTDNNASDGRGHVFILNAMTGELLRDLTTPVPSEAGGLAHLNAWIEDPQVPEIERLYGGDLDGNLWRFDMDAVFQRGKPAVLLASLKDANGKPQPITTAPLPIQVTGKAGNYPAVLVGTGKYLAIEDATDLQLQSVYAIKDDPSIRAPVTTETVAVPRVVLGNSRGPGMMSRTIASYASDRARDGRTVTGEPMDWDAKDGWFIDLEVDKHQTGDRVNVDMQVNGSSLIFLANTPSPNLCSANDGYATLYFVELNDGLPIPEQLPDPANPGNFVVNQFAGVNFGPGSIAAGNIITTDGNGHIIVNTRFSKETVESTETPQKPKPGTPAINRSSWRELID